MSQDELNKSNVADPEVVPRAKRRRFRAEYKLRILEEAEACSERGQIGSLLRREGLYSSHLTTWRHQREQGQLEALSPKKRGRKPSVDEALAKELAELKRENQRLENRLQQAETIIEVQKKLSGLLGLTPNEKESDAAI
jgi:transposase-like protein